MRSPGADATSKGRQSERRRERRTDDVARGEIAAEVAHVPQPVDPQPAGGVGEELRRPIERQPAPVRGFVGQRSERPPRDRGRVHEIPHGERHECDAGAEGHLAPRTSLEHERHQYCCQQHDARRAEQRSQCEDEPEGRRERRPRRSGPGVGHAVSEQQRRSPPANEVRLGQGDIEVLDDRIQEERAEGAEPEHGGSRVEPAASDPPDDPGRRAAGQGIQQPDGRAHTREGPEQLPGHGDQQGEAGRVLHRHGIAHQVDQAVPHSARERLAQRDVGAVVVEGAYENPVRGAEHQMGDEDEPRDDEGLVVREERRERGLLELLHPRTSGPRLYGSRAGSGTPLWLRPPSPTIVGA